jgi:hypothetical protein
MVLFVNVFGILKLYNLSGDGLWKLIPLSNLFVFSILLAYVFTAPANVVVVVLTIVCGLDWIECEKTIGVPLLSFELSKQFEPLMFFNLRIIFELCFISKLLSIIVGK